MKRFLSIAALFTLGAAALMPLPSMAQDHYERSYSAYGYDDNYRSPAPRYERTPHARRGYVWQRGYWERHGRRHVWVEGHWARDRSRMARRDLDRDGVPDAYDRDRDNDGIANHYDHDRDGDGVRNYRDRRPDNPYRD